MKDLNVGNVGRVMKIECGNLYVEKSEQFKYLGRVIKARILSVACNGCQTWPLSLCTEAKFIVFEKKMMKPIYRICKIKIVRNGDTGAMATNIQPVW